MRITTLHQQPKRSVLRLLVALFLLIGVAACAEPGFPVDEDPQLSARIENVRKNGSTALLRDLTGGNWDTVRIIPGPTDGTHVEEIVGERINLSAVAEDKSLLVFMKDKSIQRAVLTTPFSGDIAEHTNQLRLQPGPPGYVSLIDS